MARGSKSKGSGQSASAGMEWLPDVVVVAHELQAERLERGIARSTLDNRTRALRVRGCEEISLIVDDEEISSNKDTLFYAFEHDELPTLILTGAIELSWRTTARPPESAAIVCVT